MKEFSLIGILVLLIVSSSLNGICQEIGIKKPKYHRLSQTYGYLQAQQYTLDKIKEKFPDLSLEILKAELEFKTNFGKSLQNIKNYLHEQLGDKYYNYENITSAELKRVLGTQIFDKTSAIEYLVKVENRAKGKIESPVLETILSFQFQDYPEEELKAGCIKIFKTKGHVKAKNTDWQISIPISWQSKESNSPNIVQMFCSDFGDGSEQIFLMVKNLDFPKGFKTTKKDQQELFTELSMKAMVPKGMKCLSCKKIRIYSNPGGMLELETTVDNIGVQVKSKMLQFMFSRNNKLYTLHCSVASIENEDLKIRFEKYLPLFKLVANSLVVNDQFK